MQRNRTHFSAPFFLSLFVHISKEWVSLELETRPQGTGNQIQLIPVRTLTTQKRKKELIKMKEEVQKTTTNIETKRKFGGKESCDMCFEF